MNKQNEPAGENSRNGQGMSKDELKSAFKCTSIEEAKKIVADLRLRSILLLLLKRYLKAIVEFAGIGGSCLGVLNSGMDVVLAMENCRQAAEAYELNINKRTGKKTMWLHTIVNWTGRIMLIKFRGLIQKGSVALLQASPVCWLFSRANVQKKDREASVETFIATVKNIGTLQPLTFVIENVPALWDGDSILHWRKIERELIKLKYEMSTIKLDSADFKGGNQSRVRSFIVGVRHDLVAKGYSFDPPIPNVSRSENSLKKVLGAEYRFFTSGDFDHKRVTSDKPCCTLTSHSVNFSLFDEKYQKCRPSPAQIIKLSGLPSDFVFPVNKNGEFSFTRVIKGCGNLVIPSVMTAICDKLLDGVLLPYFLLKHNKALLNFIDQSKQTGF